MKQTMKRIFVHGMLASAISISVTSIITLVISASIGSGDCVRAIPAFVNKFGSDVNALIFEYSFVTGFSFICAAANEFFKIDSWNLTKATLVHFVMVFSAYVVPAWICRLFPHTLRAILLQAGFFILIYALVWISIYVRQLSAIKRINTKITDLRRGRNQN